MSRAAQRARLDAYAERELRESAWRRPVITEHVPFIAERIVDILDAEQFPEMHLAREYARRLASMGEGDHG